jgi:orotate phosphoribosyltransferase
MRRRDDIRETALKDLQLYEVLMLNGHFDFGNGFHGAVYLNPHKLFRYPSTIWQFAQDLLDVLPTSILEQTEVVTGPVTGGALLGYTVAGLLDSRRDISRPAMLFAPFTLDANCGLTLTRFYNHLLAGRRALVVDDVRNTGHTQAHCVELIRKAGGIAIATAEIYDRMEAVVDAGVPNFALADYKAPDNFPADRCPMCQAGVPVSTF